MNKKMILSIALFVSFAHLNGMNKTYSCQGIMEQGKSAPSRVDVKIIDYNAEARGISNITYQPRTKTARVVFSSDIPFQPSLDLTADGVVALAKVAAIRENVSLSTIMPGKKSPKDWRFFGHSQKLLHEFGKTVFEDELSGTLMAKNKNVTNVMIASGEGALQAEHIRAELQVPYSFNPFGSFSVKIVKNETAKNKELNLSIASSNVENLLYHAMLTEKTNANHNNINISYTEQEHNSEKIAHIDRKTMVDAAKTYFFKRLWLKRILGGFSVVGLFGLLAYLKVNQK